MKYADLRSLIEQRSDVTMGTGASPDAVRVAETQLGAIPDTYRRLLADFGWLRIGNHELLGLGEGVPTFLDVVQVTRSERTEAHPPLPATGVVLRNDGFGNLDFYDAEIVAETGDSPVMVWNHDMEVDQDPTVIAPDVATWLADLLTEAPDADLDDKDKQPDRYR
jgi:hypothetical protein